MAKSTADHVTPCGPGSRLGLGCWAIGGHGWGAVDDKDSKAAISSAFDEGVSLFDTADCYGLGHSEKTLSEALGDNRHKVIISTKGGVRWDDAGNVWKDNSSAYLRSALEASLLRLRLDSIPLYFVHWPDGKTPMAELMQTLEKMRADGLVQAVGLSNFSSTQLEEAAGFGRVDVVQVKVNLLERDDFLSLQDVCKKNTIRTMAFGCLAEGMLTGKFNKDTVFPANDHRSTRPSYQGLQWEKNLDFVNGLKTVSEDARASVANVALRSVLDQDGVDCVLFGARNQAQVYQNLTSKDLDLALQQGAISELVQKHNLPRLSWKK